jgi:hypothetical protein
MIMATKLIKKGWWIDKELAKEVERQAKRFKMTESAVVRTLLVAGLTQDIIRVGKNASPKAE